MLKFLLFLNSRLSSKWQQVAIWVIIPRGFYYYVNTCFVAEIFSFIYLIVVSFFCSTPLVFGFILLGAYT